MTYLGVSVVLSTHLEYCTDKLSAESILAMSHETLWILLLYIYMYTLGYWTFCLITHLLHSAMYIFFGLIWFLERRPKYIYFFTPSSIVFTTSVCLGGQGSLSYIRARASIRARTSFYSVLNAWQDCVNVKIVLSLPITTNWDFLSLFVLNAGYGHLYLTTESDHMKINPLLILAVRYLSLPLWNHLFGITAELWHHVTTFLGNEGFLCWDACWFKLEHFTLLLFYNNKDNHH